MAVAQAFSTSEPPWGGTSPLIIQRSSLVSSAWNSQCNPVSRTVGESSLVDEFIVRFTHTTWMDWMLPGIEPTGRAVEIPTVAIVQFQEDKLVHEHIYWDQASVLVQLGLLDPDGLPIAGAETARKVLDVSLPSNTLMTPSQATG